ncbi:MULTISPECIES: hypothetical protein [unclassified Methylobacterium]|jgi:hypothetical protein|uniref:hypothetical protein n=1 Tax=unclassified Methylobacterium TaxID=2615210 RepID=UPI0037005D16
MPVDQTAPLEVGIEAAGDGVQRWAWAIHREANRCLIVRSRPEYRDRAEALEAGLKAAGGVGARLGAEVVVRDGVPT